MKFYNGNEHGQELMHELSGCVDAGVHGPSSSNGKVDVCGESAEPIAAGAHDSMLEEPLLVGGESYEFAALTNLDLFFDRVYRYWHGRGLRSILLSGALNLLALAFTAVLSTFLILFVDWKALHAECIVPRAGGGGGSGGEDGGGAASSRGCDLAAVGLDRRPLLGRGLAADAAALSYIAVCVSYLVWSAAHYVTEARGMREVAHFMADKLGIGEGKVGTLTWAEVAARLVLVQRTTRLCITADLDELGIVARIMRKENYLVAMINRGVLRLHMRPPADAPPPLRALAAAGIRMLAAAGGGGGVYGSRGSPPLLTRTLEWNLRWAVLDHMFDERFRIRPDFYDVPALRRRLRLVALANLLPSPCLLLFLAATFLCRNAERLHRHPAALGSRRWSGLAGWRIRELNELPHYLQHRLSASHPAALRYCAQFPAHTLAAVARFLVFVTGSFVSLLLGVTFLDETLLERPLMGRQVVWWLGTLTLVLAACRTLINEEPVAYDPERALADVVSYTHHLPRAWRGRAHTDEVQSAFLSLFRLKLSLFAEEVTGLLTTPLLLATSLPDSADAIVEFVSTFTTHVEGVGDVCSLAAFDTALVRHGNTKYGAPAHADKALRSRQGKLEKSFLTFAATYPTWRPGEAGRRMLVALAAGNSGGAGGMPTARGGLPYHQDPPTTFPYHAAAAAGPGGRAAGAAQGPAADAAGAALARALSSGSARWAGRGGAGGADGKASAQASCVAAAGPPNGARLRRPASRPIPHPPHCMPHPTTHPHVSVRSYCSTAAASRMHGPADQLAAASSTAGGCGWLPPMRPGSVGGPSPSVASSQFSHLPAPYLQYYPVPMYYTYQRERQAARQAQQLQQHRMYEHLVYNSGARPPVAAAGNLGAFAPGQWAAGGPLLSEPLPYGMALRMATSSHAVDAAGLYGSGRQGVVASYRTHDATGTGPPRSDALHAAPAPARARTPEAAAAQASAGAPHTAAQEGGSGSSTDAGRHAALRAPWSPSPPGEETRLRARHGAGQKQGQGYGALSSGAARRSGKGPLTPAAMHCAPGDGHLVRAAGAELLGPPVTTPEHAPAHAAAGHGSDPAEVVGVGGNSDGVSAAAPSGGGSTGRSAAAGCGCDSSILDMRGLELDAAAAPSLVPELHAVAGQDHAADGSTGVSVATHDDAADDSDGDPLGLGGLSRSARPRQCGAAEEACLFEVVCLEDGHHGPMGGPDRVSGQTLAAGPSGATLAAEGPRRNEECSNSIQHAPHLEPGAPAVEPGAACGLYYSTDYYAKGTSCYSIEEYDIYDHVGGARYDEALGRGLGWVQDGPLMLRAPDPGGVLDPPTKQQQQRNGDAWVRASGAGAEATKHETQSVGPASVSALGCAVPRPALMSAIGDTDTCVWSCGDPATRLPPDEADGLQGRLAASHALLLAHCEARDAGALHPGRQQQQQTPSSLAEPAALGAEADSAGARLGHRNGVWEAGDWAVGSRGLGWAPPGADV